MDYFRKLAISAGILFIIYNIVDILSFLFQGPVNSANYLVKVSENASMVGTGAFLLLIGGLCASGIAISLYPVLKKFNRSSCPWSRWFQDYRGSVTYCFYFFHARIDNFKPAICKSWSSGVIVISKP